MKVGEFLKEQQGARPIYDAVRRVIDDLPGVELRVSKSQIGFYRQHPFASVWIPTRYLRGEHSPLVLSVFLRRRDESPRWKEVVEPKPGWFTHHAELRSAKDVDHEVGEWIIEAWREAA